MRLIPILLVLVLVLALTFGERPMPSNPPTSPTPVAIAAEPILQASFGGAPAPTALPKISKPRVSDNPEPAEPWKLGLREAIRIGLDNSEIVRVISLGGPSAPGGGPNPDPNSNIEIAPLNRDVSIWSFQAAVMAHVRSIEQQYWALWQQQVALEARANAVKEAEKVLARERAELEVGHNSTADIAEAEQQLENLKLGLVTATSDWITTERQLRNILGLPPADNRQIIASTLPVVARVEPDWPSCVREMNDSQPDLAQHRALARLAELQLLLARNQILPPLSLNDVAQFQALGALGEQGAPGAARINLAELLAKSAKTDPVDRDKALKDGSGFSQWQTGLVTSFVSGFGSPLANPRQAQYQLIRQRSALERITHETIHSLARFFLEVDADYKQYATARSLTIAAGQRLEAQRAFYEESRITLDRLLDAIGQHAAAIAQEAQYLAGYNASIAALEEAKGTLLGFDGIAIQEGPSPRKAYVQAKDPAVAPAAFQKPAETPSPFAPGPDAKTFRLKLGPGVEVEIPEGPGISPADPGQG